MKTRLFLQAVVVTLVATLAGCTTLQFATGTKIAVRRATVEVLKRKPAYKPAFVASATAISALLLDPQIDRAKVTATLQTLKIRELKGADGALLVNDILDLLDTAIADKPLVGDGLPKLKAVLDAVASGITEGVALSP